MYTAVVLDEPSRAKLLEVFVEPLSILEAKGFQFQTASGSPLIHHVTLNMGAFDKRANPEREIGEEIAFALSFWGENERVVALGVTACMYSPVTGTTFGWPAVCSKNKQPHITVAINIAKGGKPVHSNELVQWTPIDSVQVHGVIAEIN